MVLLGKCTTYPEVYHNHKMALEGQQRKAIERGIIYVLLLSRQASDVLKVR